VVARLPPRKYATGSCGRAWKSDRANLTPTSKPRTTVLTCANCGGPLDPPENGDRVTCWHCKRVNLIWREGEPKVEAEREPISNPYPVIGGPRIVTTAVMLDGVKVRAGDLVYLTDENRMMVATAGGVVGEDGCMCELASANPLGYALDTAAAHEEVDVCMWGSHTRSF